MSAIEPKLVNVFATVLQVPEDKITIDSSPKNLENWDSMRHVELVIAVEEAFGITFSTTEVMSINSMKGFRTALSAKDITV